MHRIAIGIPTYKRPEMLKKLIQSIIESHLDTGLLKEVNLLIVDNDRDKSAEKTVNEFKETIDPFIKIYYCCFPQKGLANVRNHIIIKSIQLVPDFLVFIDDDEYVTINWISELVKVIVEKNADAVRGPVLAQLDTNASKSIRALFVREKYADKTRLSKWSTGNLMLRVSTLVKNEIWFDSRFNDIGSEDYFFGIQMMKKGACIYWAANALVYENIPEKRATLQWIIKRTFREATTYTYIQKIEKKYAELIKKLFISIYYTILGGMASLFCLLFTNRFRYWGILKITEGVGGIVGLLNGKYREYK